MPEVAEVLGMTGQPVLKFFSHPQSLVVNAIFTQKLEPRVEGASAGSQSRDLTIDNWERPAPMIDKEQWIRETAYRLWEEDGRPIGQADRHWQMAIKLADQGQQTTSAPARVVDTRPKKKRRLRLVA